MIAKDGLEPGGGFADLGSGVGKAVFAAAVGPPARKRMLFARGAERFPHVSAKKPRVLPTQVGRGYAFDKCLGIEILEGLHAIAADKLLPRFDARVRAKLEPETRRAVDVIFCRGDAAVLDDWTDARCVFCNSTCFDARLLENLAKKASSMRAGSYFVTTTAKLPSDDFELRWRGKMAESWGDATVFVQRRVKDDDDEVAASPGKGSPKRG